MQIHELNTLGGTPGSTDFLAIDTGFDTAKISAPDLLKPIKDQADHLAAEKVNMPKDEYNQPDNGQAGQLLRTNGDGSTDWVDEGLPTDEQTAQAVSDWLNDHPEATTTVVDGSLTEAKFSASLKKKTIKDYVTPEMFGAAGDGVADDTQAVKDAIASGKRVLFANTYRITDKIELLTNLQQIEITGELKCEDAFIHIAGYNIRVFGGGAITGYAPEAFIVLGGLSDNQSVSCINAIVENLYLKATSPCMGVIIRNYYLGSYGAYCNTVRGIYAEDCTVAIDLIGDANANSISDINLMSYDNANIECMFLFEGLTYNGTVYAPLENNFSNTFYYRGIDTPTIKIKSSCGSRMSRNVFSNITGEQQGSNSIFMEIEAGATPTKNVFVGIMSNTLLGQFTPADEQTLKNGQNTYIAADKNIQQNIEAESGVFYNGVSYAKNGMSFENAFTYLGTENTQFKLFDADGTSAIGGAVYTQGAFVEVFVVENRNGVTICQRCERALLYVNNSGMSFVEQAASSRLSISGYSLNYKPGNNGTGLSGIRISCCYKVTAYNGYAKELVYNLATN